MREIFRNSSRFINLVLSVLSARRMRNRRKIERCIGKIFNSKQNPEKKQMSARLTERRASICSLEFAYPTSALSLSYLHHLIREVSSFHFQTTAYLLVRNLLYRIVLFHENEFFFLPFFFFFFSSPFKSNDFDLVIRRLLPS